ncbi:MAG TPA: glycoside hydrolase family 88 protein [Polyangiaceae bacterium]
MAGCDSSEPAGKDETTAGAAGTSAGTGGAPPGAGGAAAGSGTGAGSSGAGSGGVTGGSTGGGGGFGAGGSAGIPGGSAAGGASGSGNAAGVAGVATAGTGGTAGSAAGGASGSGGTAGVSDRDASFGDWPQGADPQSIASDLAGVFIPEMPMDPKHYKVACAWYGSLAVSALFADSARVTTLIDKYDPYIGTWDELLRGEGHVDDNVFGIVPLEIALHSTDTVYQEEGLALADHQILHIDTQKRHATDDMFMITALQVQAYRVATKNELIDNDKYLDLGASVMAEYLDVLQKDDDGLFYHHQDFHHEWARGNGWFAVGMAEILRELPSDHANYPAIRQGYEKMMNGLLGYQLKSGDGAGLWKQILDSSDVRNWPETSGSAMFAVAMVTGVREGWLDPGTYGPAARAAWLALVDKLTDDGKLQDISDWAYKPESHPESGDKYDDDEENYYFDRPKLTGDNHGQAPMMWLAAALAR